nr:MAG: hypothetical protein [Cressdnaviricota sp.]
MHDLLKVAYILKMDPKIYFPIPKAVVLPKSPIPTYKGKAKEQNMISDTPTEENLFFPNPIVIDGSSFLLTNEINPSVRFIVVTFLSDDNIIFPTAQQIFSTLTQSQRVVGFNFKLTWLNNTLVNDQVMNFISNDPNIDVTNSPAFEQTNIALFNWEMLWLLTNIQPPQWTFYDISASGR